MEIENQNIQSYRRLISPLALSIEVPATAQALQLVGETRKEVADIVAGDSQRLLFVVGPCSIHNVQEARHYGSRLAELARKVRTKILVVMRVYFEKPRTTVGWKGLINDPDLDGTYQVNKGLKLARELLVDLNAKGVPCGCEVLDTITPQYLSDLISWGAIGARTTESQVHRQLVSGLSMPVGFKNGTGGSVKLAADAVLSASLPHCFMGITNRGEPAICSTKGNKDTHIILRGGSQGPNYYPDDVAAAASLLAEREVPQAVLVDCSHGNSGKNHKNQHKVLRSVVEQIERGRRRGATPIIGVMIESNLNEGKQELGGVLAPGISVTDSCIGFEETERIVLAAYRRLGGRIEEN